MKLCPTCQMESAEIELLMSQRQQSVANLLALLRPRSIYILAALTVLVFCSSASSQGHSKNQWRQILLAGRPLLMSKELTKQERTIPAKWMVEAVKKGESIYIRNAVIEGDLILRNQTFAGNFHLDSCNLMGEADFSYTHFTRLVEIENSKFHKKVDFTSSIVDENVFLVDDDFRGKFVFADADIKGALICGNPEDETKSTHFHRGVDFKGTRIARRLEMSFAQFKSSGRNESSFNDLIVGGYASFYKTVFHGPVRFDRATFKKTIYFSNAVFKDEAHFPLIRVEGNAFFCGTVFERGVSFSNSLVVNGFMRFDEARLNRRAIFDFVEAKTISFCRSRFSPGEALYSNQPGLTLRSSRFNVIDFGDQLPNSGLRSIDLGNCEYIRLQFIECSNCRPRPPSQSKNWDSNIRHLSSLSYPTQMEPYLRLEKFLRGTGFNELADEIYYEGRKKMGNQYSLLSWAGLQDRFLRFLVGYGVINHRIFYWLVVLMSLGILVFYQNDALEPKDGDRCPIHNRSCKGGGHLVGGMELFWVILGILLPLINVIAGERWIPRNKRISTINQGCWEFTKSWIRRLRSIWRSLFSWMSRGKACLWWLQLLPFLMVRVPSAVICGLFLSVMSIPLFLALILMKAIRVSPTYVGFATLLKLVGWILIPVGIAALTGFLQH